MLAMKGANGKYVCLISHKRGPRNQRNLVRPHDQALYSVKEAFPGGTGREGRQ